MLRRKNSANIMTSSTKVVIRDVQLINITYCLNYMCHACEYIISNGIFVKPEKFLPVALKLPLSQQSDDLRIS